MVTSVRGSLQSAGPSYAEAVMNFRTALKDGKVKIIATNPPAR